jgi:endonuclease/exonuclease/phosphatase family metal-dependent hydrolase
MRIATYNIMSGGFDSYTSTSRRPERLQQLKKVVALLNADFIALIDTFRWADELSLEFIRTEFDYQYVYSINMDDDRVDNRIGLTILSKEPFKAETLRIHNRNCIKATFRQGTSTYTIYTTYLDDLSEDTRLLQIKPLILDTPSDKTIILGDLNTFSRIDGTFSPPHLNQHTPPQQDILNRMSHIVRDMSRCEITTLLEQNKYVDLMTDHTSTFPTALFPGGFPVPFLRLDYIFHTPDIHMVPLPIPQSDLWDTTSDHLPVYGKILEV